MLLTRNKFRELSDGIEHMRELIHTETEKTERSFDSLRDSVARHDTVIEDMLDSWQEWQAELTRITAEYRGKLSDEEKKRCDAAEKREMSLLALTVSCLDQMYALRQVSQDENWTRQLRLTEEKVGDLRLDCGLQVIEETGVSLLISSTRRLPWTKRRTRTGTGMFRRSCPAVIYIGIR